MLYQLIALKKKVINISVLTQHSYQRLEKNTILGFP